MDILVINTGGTFNKVYNPLNGKLEVAKGNNSLNKIISSCHNVNFEIKNIITKDSLDFTDADRQEICEVIKYNPYDKIIIVHGTDTIDLTSSFIKREIHNKKIVFTGAMVPMSIEESEATMNFSMALGFLNGDVENGTYISMHGVVVDCSKLVKNRELGQFLIQE